MRFVFLVLLLITVVGCKKESEKKITIADINPYLQLPYEDGETVIFYSSNSSFVTQVKKKKEQWLGWDGDTIHTSEIAEFIADGYKPYFLQIDVGGTGNYDTGIMNFTMFPDAGIEIGNSTQLAVELSNGNFVCDGFRNTFDDSLILNDNIFYDVVELNLNGGYSGTSQIFYSGKYGVIGYADKTGKIFAIKP